MNIPADVPKNKQRLYRRNMNKVTYGTGKLFLFAGDQRVEHLDGDFSGKGIAKGDESPEHFFKIASQAKIGAFATQLGFIARFGKKYKKIPYIVKLNSKTNLVSTKQQDPHSKAWFSVEDVVKFKKQSRLDIVGVGYTCYIGSEFEKEILHEAAQAVFQAHQHGLIAILWMYPRGKAVKQEKTPQIIAGAANVGSALGADFIKLNPPQVRGKKSHKDLAHVVRAAGESRVICTGGSSTNVKLFLQELFKQLHDGGTFGSATGRNIHQKPLKEAVAFCDAMHAMVVLDATVPEAMRLYSQAKK